MKTSMNQVLDLLLSEETDEATARLHQFFVEAAKQANAELMQEDASLSQDIEDDQEAIESEQFYDSEDETAEGDAEELDGDVEAGDDLGDDLGDELAGDELGGEAEAPTEVVIADTIEDLQGALERLKAEFQGLIGAEDEAAGPVDELGGDEFADAEGDTEEMADDTDESLAFESEESEDDDLTESEDEDEDEDEDDAEEVTESEDDFADLEESWTLETVKDPNLNGGKEIGADGAKVNVNDKSPLPSHKAEDRVGGAAVEIKSSHHEGHEREPAPEVKGKPLLKNQVKKSTDGRTKVSKEGDKSAMLNSNAGFGSDSPKSPIGQAADLRGSDFKRK